MLMSMNAETRSRTMTTWQRHREARDVRIEVGSRLARGKIVEASDATRLMEAVIRPGDRVCLEGDNQKQADLLSSALLAVDLAKVNDLHMVQSGVVLPEHLDLYDRGVAKKLDYAYSGPQSARIATMLFGGKIELGAVHTYLELFARYFIDRPAWPAPSHSRSTLTAPTMPRAGSTSSSCFTTRERSTQSTKRCSPASPMSISTT